MNDEQLMNMTPEEIMAYLDQKLANKPDEVPEGWHTVIRLAKAWSVSDQSAGKRINLAVRHGLMEKRMFRIETESGVLRPVAHYRVLKN